MSPLKHDSTYTFQCALHLIPWFGPLETSLSNQAREQLILLHDWYLFPLPGASSKATNKVAQTIQCSSGQFELGYVRSLVQLLESFGTASHAGARSRGHLRLLLASFNHRLIDQLTTQLGKQPLGNLVHGKISVGTF
jgi:hypothetical protein